MRSSEGALGTRRTAVLGKSSHSRAKLDVDRPNPGRVYDWFLGGNSNWAIDRVFGQRLLGMWPQAAGVARQNRSFMQRVVTDALDAGIHQFLDLGSGIPTMGNVHEILQLRTSEPVRVVYVECDPVAAAHTRAYLQHTDWAGVAQADLLNWREVLADVTTQRLLDLDQPVCLLAVSALQFVGPDDNIADVLRRYGSELAPGSRIALSHFASDVPDPLSRAAMERFRTAYGAIKPVWLRDRGTITDWFDGLGDHWTLLNPGVAQLPDWRPDLIAHPKATEQAETEQPYAWCGVAAHDN